MRALGPRREKRQACLSPPYEQPATYDLRRAPLSFPSTVFIDHPRPIPRIADPFILPFLAIFGTKILKRSFCLLSPSKYLGRSGLVIPMSVIPDATA